VKPRLTVLLGAGSTVSLNSEIPTLCGMPSTTDLTTRISRMEFPKIVRTGIPFLQSEGDQKPLAMGETIPVLSLITRALSGTFVRVNFELILHAIEQLLPLASMRTSHASSDQFHPTIGAFVEILKRYDILNDPSLLRVTRECIISAIHAEIHNRSFHIPKEFALRKLIVMLSQEFQLTIFTLNYDDVVDRACPTGFDGFVGDRESSASGASWEAHSFEAQAFDMWRNSMEPVLVHLHGSVRFGPSRHGFELVKYSSSTAAGEAMEAVSRGNKSSGGQIVSSDSIISGLNKAARLTLNPIPYGYYYKVLIDSLLSSERLLVIGYGAADEHVNTWLRQFRIMHGENSRVGWIGMLKGEMVGERTLEKDMIAVLSDGKFQDFRHNSAREEPNSLMECGDELRLGVAGFPLPDDTLSELVSFLRG
jgi:hypothetical protein